MPPKKNYLRSNRICFTLNNYTEEECLQLETLLNSLLKNIEYCIIGKEVGANGTPHLQGFIHFHHSFLKARDGTLSKWRSLIPALSRAHMESAFGTDEQSRDYCAKENVFLELGKPGSNLNLYTRLLSCNNLEECAALCPETTIRCYNQLKQITQTNKRSACHPPAVTSLRPWQKEVYDKLMKQTDRRILFVQDKHGNSGKSHLAKYIRNTHGSDVFYCRGGKAHDIIHAFSKGDYKIAIFDYARNKQPQYFAWDIFEELKDGCVSSGKYDSDMFWLGYSVKIVVLTNHDVHDHKHLLTYDRWQIVDLDDYRAMAGEHFNDLVPVEVEPEESVIELSEQETQVIEDTDAIEHAAMIDFLTENQAQREDYFPYESFADLLKHITTSEFIDLPNNDCDFK